jgi:hypothetical protein
MRLGFTSDLHVDHHPEVVDRVAARVQEARIELLIVAGDVSPHDAALVETLSRLCRVTRVAFVPGNHDLWTVEGGPDSRARYLEIIPELCARAEAVCLSEGPHEIDGVTLVGQTGWYDYSLADPTLCIPPEHYRRGRFGRLAWTDKQRIRWPGLDDQALCAWMTARLARDLEAVRPDAPVVVVTHMLPFVELAVRKPLPWGFVGGFLGAVSLGQAIVASRAAGARIERVIAGHTHFARRAEVQAAGHRLIAETSPIGYPREVAYQARDLAEHVERRLQVVDV